MLALPLQIIGRAVEETVREANRMAVERERQLKIILVERAKLSNRDVIDSTGLAENHSDQVIMGVERDIKRLDAEKAIREQYDVEVARSILLHLMDNLGDITGDSRFDAAAQALLKPADYY